VECIGLGTGGGVIPNLTYTYWLIFGWLPALIVVVACVVFALRRRSAAAVGLAIGAVGLPLSVFAEIGFMIRWVSTHQHLFIGPSVEPARTGLAFTIIQLVFALVFAVSLCLVLNDASRLWRDSGAGAST
jgi:hypothetical protein